MNILARATIVGDHATELVGFSSCEKTDAGTFTLIRDDVDPEVSVRWQAGSPYSEVIFAIDKPDPENDAVRSIQSRIQGAARDIGQFDVLILGDES